VRCPEAVNLTEMSEWLCLGLVVIALGYGLAAGSLRYPPYASLRRALTYGLAIRRRLMRVSSPIGPVATLVIDISSEGDIAAKRQSLIAYIWSEGALPLDRLPTQVEHNVQPLRYRTGQNVAVHRFRIEMDFGVDSVVEHHVAASERETLVIYHEGHDAAREGGEGPVRHLLNAGYSVLVFSMPLMGVNSRPTVRLARHGSVQLLDHDFFWLLDAEHPGFSSLRFFVEPVVAGINYGLAKGYRECAMMGISGGAWTTTLVAALDSRIRGSYPVAGSLPFSLRGRGELADYENHVPPLYAIANYPELYVMGADTPTRTQIQVFNRYDPVGWSGDRGKCYEAQVQDVLARLGGGRFQVLVDDSHAGHRISRVALDRVLIDLCGGREGRSRDANGL